MRHFFVRSAFLITASVIGTAVGATALEAGGGGGGGVSSCRGVEREGDGLRVAVSQSCFSPIVLHVEPGATVKWSNGDPIPHNVAAMGEEWSDGRPLAGGGSVSMTFAEPGIFPYYCAFHPGMVGVIAVSGEPVAKTKTEPSAHPAERGVFLAGEPDGKGYASPQVSLESKVAPRAYSGEVLGAPAVIIAAVALAAASGGWIGARRRKG